MAKWRICVDLDSAREEAEDLESKTIEAKDEDEAMNKADHIVKAGYFGGPYYTVMEDDDWDGSNYPKDNPLGEDV